MAKNETVWGIDVGNTSLKALRCRKGAEPGTIEVLQFDYIEHSKILTQPGADAHEILAETLQTFPSADAPVTVTRLAFGLPADSGVAYSDPLTLRRAIVHRCAP